MDKINFAHAMTITMFALLFFNPIMIIMFAAYAQTK